MDLFYIDRQFGAPIFIEVENGVVKKVSNESLKYNARMEAEYLGKTITFLKQDFEARMKPTYHNVRPLALHALRLNITAVESKIDNINKLLSSYKTVDEQQKELQAKREELQKELSAYEKELRSEITRMKTEHNFIVA
jgi:hypothetical protein